MAIRSTVLSVLLISTDPDLPAQLKQDFRDAAVTVAKDLASLSRSTARKPFDVVLIESRRATIVDITELQRLVDPLHTLVLAGPRWALRQAPGVVQAMARRGAGMRNGADVSLEQYLENKIGDFVKDMKNGSARNLHPMLIKAVERPLISLALKETNGNQIQAAHLLGMNRNTLRKKIIELRIPVKRVKVPVT